MFDRKEIFAAKLMPIILCYMRFSLHTVKCYSILIELSRFYIIAIPRPIVLILTAYIVVTIIMYALCMRITILYGKFLWQINVLNLGFKDK